MFGIAVCDENGAELTVLKLDSDAAKTAFINVLKGKAGETKEVKFSKKNVAKDKVKDVLKKAKTFKVKYLSVALENVNLSGNIGKYPVCMTLNIDENGVITGAYYYKRMGVKALLYMKGALEDGKFKLMSSTFRATTQVRSMVHLRMISLVVSSTRMVHAMLMT